MSNAITELGMVCPLKEFKVDLDNQPLSMTTPFLH